MESTVGRTLDSGGLSELPFHDWVGVAIVDSVVETIRLALEVRSIVVGDYGSS